MRAEVCSEMSSKLLEAILYTYTEEKLGTSEKTELDAHFESLALRSDTTKQWTEKILMKAESVLTPNPNNRYEDYVYEKLDKKRDRLTNAEHFGLDLIEAGNEFGPGAAYGSALIKVGHSQNKIGQAEKEFIHAAGTNYIQPLHKFLDTDMKTILKERRILESKRLDLDACKSRLRKAKSMESQTSAEQDLRFAQTEFDRQAEITKLLLEGISSTHENSFEEATFKQHSTNVSTTMFQQPKRRLYTWKSPGDWTRNQIDYFLIHKRFKNSVVNIRTYPGADINSDHSPVIANMHTKLKKATTKSKKVAKYDLEALKV
ncbi:Endophilin-B1 [Nymphon striatum]|nr:Endophilin-B1 [Nymphon striatum]